VGAEAHMSCPVDTDMVVVSSGFGSMMIGRAPPPFSCGPKASESDYAGYWDTRCPNKQCRVDTAYSNARGRTDTEGCCWWGRGALLTRGVCNIGKLNYYLGREAAERGEGIFPDTDFCANPGSICEGTEELRWLTALFEWVERVQEYPGDWDYKLNLRRFTYGGMWDDEFVDTVSSIFTRGCHAEGCAEIAVTKEEERRKNFKTVLAALGLPLETDNPTGSPTTDSPTGSPTTDSPTTDAPTTESPTTESPTTESPTTESPTTESPTTDAPTTESPTTDSPTLDPPTLDPPTLDPPTLDPPTLDPPTLDPQTPKSPTPGPPTQGLPTPNFNSTLTPSTSFSRTAPSSSPQNYPDTNTTMIASMGALSSENSATGSTQQGVGAVGTPLVPTAERLEHSDPSSEPKTELIPLEGNVAASLALSRWAILPLTIFICAFCF